MCRMLAQVSPRPADARVLIAGPECSLLAQADADPKNPQTDGWGLAWFGADGRPRVVKSGRAAPSERERLSRAAGEAVSTIVIAHVRAASKGCPVDDAHAHPFEDGGWVFAHNGTLAIHREVAEALGPRRARLETRSDSEVYFQQFLKHLEACGEPSRAFEACVAENWRIWESCRARYPGVPAPYTSLNALASDGRALHVLCHAASRGLAECGVCHPDQPWSVMSESSRGGRWLVSSEGADRGEWTRLSPPVSISAVPMPSGVDVRRRALALSTPQRAVPEVSLA
ncbi:MAG: class II glutamine amidotransferase [Elusimicrobia bacterium]|nr:class II glutamine amidotransferase [Elusimicrobiota bacterium]